MVQPPVPEDKTLSPAIDRGWPLRTVIAAMVLILAVQATFLPCLCPTGAVRIKIALAVDLVVFVRVLIAMLRDENGRGWIIYLLLAASSLFWIPLIVRH